MADKRKAKRRHIIYYLRVYDQNTSQLIGQLVDITTSGIKLISEREFEKDAVMKLRMELPEEIDHKKEIVFDALTLWCRRDVNPNFHSIGCEFVKIEPEDVNIIKSLIYEYAFRD